MQRAFDDKKNNAPPLDPSKLHKCHWPACFNTANLKACSRCKKVKYCGRDCQSRDWAQHKLVCRNLANSTAQQQQEDDDDDDDE